MQTSQHASPRNPRTGKALWLRSTGTLGLTVLWGASLATPTAATCDDFIATQLANHQSTNLRVIVRFDGKPTSYQLSRLASCGADVYRHLDIIDSVAATIPASKIREVENLPFVRHLSSDATLHKTDLFTVGSSYAATAWSTYKVSGSGVGVAVLDTGINPVDDLGTSRLVAAQNWSDEPDNLDHCGHGTHVAGIIGGNGTDSSGTGYTKTFYGIAPSVNLISLKILDAQGSGSVSNAISAIQWAVTNRRLYNIRVLNMSLGHDVGESYKADPLCLAAEGAWKNGIVVVCAAGNEGRLHTNPTTGQANGGYGNNYGSITVPGNDPYVITVGAMKSIDGIRAHDQIATYSSRGATRIDHVMKPDIVAPGNKVISTENPSSDYLLSTYPSMLELPLNSYTTSTSGYSSHYFVLSGTSMASPVVAGAAALMLQAQPSLSPDTVKARLMVSADKWTDPSGNGDPCTYGAGYLNIPAAMASKLTASSSVKSPPLVEGLLGDVDINTGGLLNLLGLLWGILGLTDLHTVWGQHAIWGNNTLASSHAVWGTAFWTNNSTYSVTNYSTDLTPMSVLVNGE